MRSLLASEVRYADAGIQRCIEQRTTPGQPNVRSVVPRPDVEFGSPNAEVIVEALLASIGRLLMRCAIT